MADAPLIMIVDDDWMNRELLQTILEHSGYRACHASDGEEALRLVGHHKPDVMLLDVRMDGLNGYQVCARLKANVDTRHIRVIILTALGDSDERREALKAGADDFIPKMAGWKPLLDKIQRLLAPAS